MSWQGQTVYITGGSGGIGAEMARQFAADGAKVALFARRQSELDGVVQGIVAAGGLARAYAADVTDRASVLAAMAKAFADVGPADLAILNAGISDPISARRFDGLKAARVMQVNVLGAIYTLEAVLPSMVERKRGHIVGISSLASYFCFPGGSAYSASKLGLNMMLRTLRAELAPHNIAVTTICPGFIKTHMTAGQRLPMPLMMSCEAATDRILGAIRAKRKVYNFPRRMHWLMRLAGMLPDKLIMTAMAPRKKS